MNDSSPHQDSLINFSTIEFEPKGTDEFGNKTWIRLETIYGFQIKSVVNEQEFIQEISTDTESVKRYENPAEATKNLAKSVNKIRNFKNLQEKEQFKSNVAIKDSEILHEPKPTNLSRSLKLIQSALNNPKKSEITAAIGGPKEKSYARFKSNSNSLEMKDKVKNVSNSRVRKVKNTAVEKILQRTTGVAKKAQDQSKSSNALSKIANKTEKLSKSTKILEKSEGKARNEKNSFPKEKFDEEYADPPNKCAISAVELLSAKLQGNIKEKQSDIVDNQNISPQFLISKNKTENEANQYQFTEDCSIQYKNAIDIQPEECLFQYNVINSFKSDRAMMRNVSHTIVSGVQSKSSEEIVKQARQELERLEKESRQIERDKAVAAQAKYMASCGSPTFVINPDTAPITPVRKPGRPPGIVVLNHQCPICLIKFRTDFQLAAHITFHDKSKAPRNSAEMTKNIYEEVRMKIEQLGSRRSFHVLLPDYDYAFIVRNSTTLKLYMKCFRETCNVRAYGTPDGKFYLKKGEKHSHGPDKDVILSKIDAAKKRVSEKANAINKQVHIRVRVQAIIKKQKEKTR